MHLQTYLPLPFGGAATDLTPDQLKQGRQKRCLLCTFRQTLPGEESVWHTQYLGGGSIGGDDFLIVTHGQDTGGQAAQHGLEILALRLQLAPA